MATSTSTSPADLVLRYYAAINARDWAAYDELFTPDCELSATGSPTTRGVDAVRALDQGYVSVFPDLRIDSLRRHVVGSTVTSENIGSGTMLAELPGPAGPLPPTGAHAGVPYVGVFDIRDGRIAAQRLYLDRLAILEQTGSLAAMAG